MKGCTIERSIWESQLPLLINIRSPQDTRRNQCTDARYISCKTTCGPLSTDERRRINQADKQEKRKIEEREMTGKDIDSFGLPSLTLLRCLKNQAGQNLALFAGIHIIFQHFGYMTIFNFTIQQHILYISASDKLHGQHLQISHIFSSIFLK